MSLKKIVFLLVLFCGHLLYSQCLQNIHVIDNKGNPVIEYNIDYKNKIYKCRSQSSFIKLKKGEYLTIQKKGYYTQGLIASDTLKKIILTEEDNSLELNPLVITGTRTIKPLSESAVYTRVITAKDIVSGGNTSIESVLEREVPSISFSNHAGVSNVQLHGLGGNRVLFLVNGERLAGETRNNTDYSQININDIERIEIVQGASSTLYGSGAIGGVINIITKTYTSPYNFDINTSYNSDRAIKSSLSASININKLYLKSELRFDENPERVYTDRELDKTYYENGDVIKESILNQQYIRAQKLWSAQQEINYKATENLNLNLKYNQYAKYQKRTGLMKDIIQDNYRGKNVIFNTTWNQSEKWNHQLLYNYSYYEKEDEFLKLKEKETNYKNDIHNIKYLTNYKIGKTNLQGGLEYMGENLKTYMFANDGTKEVYMLSALSELDWNIAKNMFLLVGTRVDHHQHYGTAVTPKIAFKHNIWKKFNARWSYSAGFRSPSLKELYTDWDHLGAFRIIGNTDLQPEKSNNYMITLEKEGKDVYASATLFKNDIKQKLGLRWNNAHRDTLLYKNIDNQSLWGVDFISKIRINKDLRLNLGYSYTNDKTKEDGRVFSETRPHSANFSIDYNVPIPKNDWNLSLSCNGNYHSKLELLGLDEKKGYYINKYPAYFLLNANAILSYKKYITINVGAKNVLNYKTKNYNFYTPLVDGVLYNINMNINLN